MNSELNLVPMRRTGTRANSKSTLRPFGKLSAQGERYCNGILIVPFMVSLSNHLSRSWWACRTTTHTFARG